MKTVSTDRLQPRGGSAPPPIGVRNVACLVSLYLAVSCNAPVDLDGARAGIEKPELVDAGIQRLMPNTKAGSMAPNIALTSRGPILSWLEPDEPGSKHFSLRVSTLEGNRWSSAQTIVEGDDFFANWADFPSVAEGPGGELAAHWLRKIDSGTYAYGIGVATSSDGDTWEETGWLHDDLSPTEHGFVSFAPSADQLLSFWLDGRAMERGEPMSLRVRSLADRQTASTVLDERVCECCQTDAAITDQGPLVVYRNRTEQEIRDPWFVRRTGSEWSEPQPIHEDGWKIAGCPVNGPAVAASGKQVAVAWFTAANNQPRVRLALSSDSGESFSAPILIDDKNPLGRVDTAVDQNGDVWVSWLGRTLDGAGVVVLRIDSSGKQAGQPIRIANTSAERASGFARMVSHGDRLLLAWTEAGDNTHIAVAAIDL